MRGTHCDWCLRPQKNLGNDKTCSQASSKRFSVYNPKILGNVKFTIHGIVLFEGVYNPKILGNDKCTS